MSNLSNEVPFPEEPVNDENPPSSRVMLFTIVLLIAGLLMSGTMLLYYANSHRGALAQTTPETGEASQTDSPKSSFFEKMSSKISDPAASAPTPGDSGVMNQLFGARNSSDVNWPKLKLTGFGSATDGSGGFAFINKRKYRQGDLIDGKVMLVEIRTHDVLMEYMGETNTLSMNISN